jgi:recombinational DNA repair protein RecR
VYGCRSYAFTIGPGASREIADGAASKIGATLGGPMTRLTTCPKCGRVSREESLCRNCRMNRFTSILLAAVAVVSYLVVFIIYFS